MLANAMWYGSAEGVERDRALKIGPVILSLATVLVSVYSSLTVVPINLIVVQLFRKSKPRFMVELPDGTRVEMKNGSRIATKPKGKRITNMLKYQSNDPFAPPTKDQENFESVEDAEMVIEDLEDELESGKEFKRKKIVRRVRVQSAEGDKPKKKKKRKYWFPWWCVPVSWTLCILATALSLFFVLLYSLQWGRTKSEEWMSALLLSFVQSVVIIQPIKVKHR